MEKEHKFNIVDFYRPNIKEGGLRTKRIFKSSTPDQPLISIITTVKNGQKHLEEALNSLKKQTYKNFEHIIIDGNSSDETLNIIKKNEDQIDYWISNNDKGIYDGFNIGMSLAKGQYLGFLNSDDQFTTEALSILVGYIKKYKDLDFIFGSVKKHWGILYGYKPWKIRWSWGFYSSHSTGFFIKTKSAQNVGLYNLKYKFSSDYDYFYRMIVHHKMKGIGTKKNELFGIFRRGGFSSSINFISHFFEEIQIRIDNKQSKILILLIFIYKYLKNFSKIK